MPKYPINSLNPSLYRSYSSSPLEELNFMMSSFSDSYFDDLMVDKDIESFEAYVLSGLRTEDNTGASLDVFDAKMNAGYLEIVIMPKDKSIGNIEDIRTAKDKQHVMQILSRHHDIFKARSENIATVGVPLHFGQKVICSYLRGSISESNQRMLVFKMPNFVDIESSFDSVKKLGFKKELSSIFSSGAFTTLGPTLDVEGEHPYKDMIIEGSVFPGDPIRYDLKSRLRREMIEEYVPAAAIALAGETRGLRLLAQAQAIKEGFYKNTRSYIHNNPGNILNTDAGGNVGYPTLIHGIKKQSQYIKSVATGTEPAYRLNKQRNIKPYYSPEIAKNQKNYGGRSPYLPGYRFIYTGQLDQYIKIYSTGARAGNSYISFIVSFFLQNGLNITPQTTIQQIINLN